MSMIALVILHQEKLTVVLHCLGDASPENHTCIYDTFILIVYFLPLP